MKNTIEEKQFRAVLAKNQLMRLIRQSDLFYSNKILARECLKDIEDYIGQMNQPTVEALFDDKANRL